MKERSIHTSMPKRRYKVVKPFRFFMFILICIMTLTFSLYGIFGNGHADASAETKYAKVMIQENDTLWNIIDTYNPHANIDIRMALYDVYEINGIESGDIHPGDTILIPIYE